MPKIAEVVNDVIVSVVIADSVEDAQQLRNRECVDLSTYPEESMPGIGWVRTDGVFSIVMQTELEE